jgi:hypothetical protein
VNDTAELNIAIDFRLRELHGKVGSFFWRGTEFCVGSGRPRRELRSNLGEGGPVCPHQQRPHFVPQSVLHFFPYPALPTDIPVKTFLFIWTLLCSTGHNTAVMLSGHSALTCGLQLYPYFPWPNSPQWAIASSLSRLHDHTQPHDTR